MIQPWKQFKPVVRAQAAAALKAPMLRTLLYSVLTLGLLLVAEPRAEAQNPVIDWD